MLGRQWYFVLVLFVSLVAGFEAGANEVVLEAARWRRAGVSLEKFSTELGTKSCHQTERQFLGCWSAYEYLSQAGQKLLSLRWVEDGQGLFGLADWTATNDQTALRPGPQELAHLYRLAKKKGFKKNRVEFSNIMKVIRSHLDNHPLQPYFAAEAMNRYLAFKFDPHTTIFPEVHGHGTMMGLDSGAAGAGRPVQGGLAGNLVQWGQIHLLFPDQGSEAERAGIRRYDELLAVNGHEVYGMSGHDVSRLFLGPVGTELLVRIARDGQIYQTSVRREVIVDATLEVGFAHDLNGRYGRFKLKDFMSDGTCFEMARWVLVMDRSVDGWVIDLRGNPGGQLTEALCIAGIFLGSKPMIGALPIEPKLTDAPQWMNPQVGAGITDKPMIVLIDGGSASASELFAGVMQDYGRAWIVGEQSYGKATAQATERYHGKKGVLLNKTGFQFILPSGRSYQALGIQPDVMTESREMDRLGIRFARSDREQDLLGSVVRGQSRKVGAYGKVWDWSFRDRLRRLQSCVLGAQVAEGEWAERESEGRAVDFQSLLGQELLDCEVSARALEGK